jgi:hypothetical protein
MFRLANATLILAVVAAAPALADFSSPAMPVELTRTSGYYSGPGGEFTMTPGAALASRIVTGTVSDISSATWQAFCVEYNEYVNVPGSYYGDINTFAAAGGLGGQDGFEGPGGTASDSLDPRTAYLYQNFRLGTLLTSYSYTPSRSADAEALQNAIWYIEGEVTGISGKAVTLYNEAVEATEIGQLYNDGTTDGIATWTGIGNVRILNLWDTPDHTGNHQDQLTLVPTPGAALLGVIGLTLVCRLRRQGA